MSTPRTLLSGLALCCLACPALAPAQSAPQSTKPVCPAPAGPDASGATDPDCPRAQHLSAITVSATLNPRPVADVAADVSIITRKDMDRHLVSDLRSLVRYEPGVSVTASPGRYGQSGFNIRGLGGNRVHIEIDGVPVSDAFSFGSMLSAGRNRVDMDSIKRVEIVRGPASSLYGSDALGGVVSYTSKDPIDYLRGRKGPYVSIKEGYDTANRGHVSSATLAVGNARNGLVLLGTHRSALQTNNRGQVDTRDTSRTRPDPQDLSSDSVLAKYVHRSGRHKDTLTLDLQRDEGRTTMWSKLAAPTASMQADDHSRRYRLSFGQDWERLDTAVADRVHWRIWTQRSRVKQHTEELRQSGPGYLRHVEESFQQRVFGLQGRAFKHVQTANTVHDITWGVDFSRTRSTELRTGHAQNLLTGDISQSTSGGNADNYPVRDFPPADTSAAAVFVQDEMALADGHLRLIPGLRFDHFRFKPRHDALFDAQPLAGHVAGQTNQHLSPRVGLVWQFSDKLNTYVQYASGFRAPPYSDLGMLFSNLRYGYAVIPNPELKPETSRSLELGLRGESLLGHFTMALYSNRYHDFIETEHMLSPDQWPDWATQTPGLFLVFQSVNLNQARIRGVEVSGALYLDALSESLYGWSLKGSASISRGDTREPGTAWAPMDTVDPARAVLGLSYDAEQWGVELMATGVVRKHRLASASSFRAPGYTRFDLYARYAPLPNLRLYLGLDNLGDHRYWDWGNLHGGTIGTAVDDSGIIDRYSAPGRALKVSVRYTF